MRKINVVILFLIGLVLDAIGGVMLAISATSGMPFSVATGRLEFTSTASANALFFFLAIAAILLGTLCFIIARIGALMRTARLARWGWFASLITLGALGLLFYVIGGSDKPAPPQPL